METLLLVILAVLYRGWPVYMATTIGSQASVFHYHADINLRSFCLGSSLFMLKILPLYRTQDYLRYYLYYRENS